MAVVIIACFIFMVRNNLVFLFLIKDWKWRIFPQPLKRKKKCNLNLFYGVRQLLYHPYLARKWKMSSRNYLKYRRSLAFGYALLSYFGKGELFHSENFTAHTVQDNYVKCKKPQIIRKRSILRKYLRGNVLPVNIRRPILWKRSQRPFLQRKKFVLGFLGWCH